jgi:hypothetical protein
MGLATSAASGIGVRGIGGDTGVFGSTFSATGPGGLFQNTNAGPILRGLNNAGATVFNVAGSGATTATGFFDLATGRIAGLLGTCTPGQIMKVNPGGTNWQCDNDATSGGGGGGDIDAVLTPGGSGLLGGASSGSVSLSIDSSIVPLLNASNNFSGDQTIFGTLTGTAALSGAVATFTNSFTTGAARGLYGLSLADSGIGVVGGNTTTATTGTPVGLYAFVESSTGIAAQFQNNAGGMILQGRVGAGSGMEVFRVSGAGDIFGSGGLFNMSGIRVSLSTVCLAGQIMKWDGVEWQCDNDATSGGGGTGDIDAVIAGTGLTGGATSGPATLAIDTAVVPQLGALNTFTQNQTAPRFISNVATGTQPFGVSSTTTVTNLSADRLDGLDSAIFARTDVGNIFSSSQQINNTVGITATVGLGGDVLQVRNNASGGVAILAFADSASGSNTGLRGTALSGIGVQGDAPVGVRGVSSTSTGTAGQFLNTNGSGRILSGQSGGGALEVFSVFSSGVTSMRPLGSATPASGFNSGSLELSAAAFNLISSATQEQKFHWRAEPVGNNTASPSAKLTLAFGQGASTPAVTGLEIASTGIITFAPGQTFPGGSGDITDVLTAAGSGLQGGVTTGAANLSLITSCANGQILQWTSPNWACATVSGTGDVTDVLQSTGIVVGNSAGPAPTVAIDTTVVPQKNAANTFTADQTINANLTVDINTLFVEASTNRVGIGTTLPTHPLHVTTSSGAEVVRVQQNGSGPGLSVSALNATASNVSVVTGFVQAPVGTARAVLGSTSSPDGYGVQGQTAAGTGTGRAVYGLAQGTAAVGVEGEHTGSAAGIGVRGVSSSTTGTGLRGEATAVGGATIGVRGIAASTTDNAVGVLGEATGILAATHGVRGTTASTSNNAAGVKGEATGGSGVTFGVLGVNASTSGFGVQGENSAAGGTGVRGEVTAATGSTNGVWGRVFSVDGTGLRGEATSSSGNTTGLYALVGSASGTAAVIQNSSAAGRLIRGQSGAGATEVFRVEGSGAVLANSYLDLTTSKNVGLSLGCSNLQVMQYNGTNWVCASVGGTGTVTSVGSGTGLLGGPITGSGTLSVDFIASGGENGTATSVARSDHIHDTRYAETATGNTFTGNQTFNAGTGGTFSVSAPAGTITFSPGATNFSSGTVNMNGALTGASATFTVIGGTTMNVNQNSTSALQLFGIDAANSATGASSSSRAAAVRGRATSGVGTSNHVGVQGTASGGGIGMEGIGGSIGVRGSTSTTSSFGVEGVSPHIGVRGENNLLSGATSAHAGVAGIMSQTSGGTGVRGEATHTSGGIGVFGLANSSVSTAAGGVFQNTNASGKLIRGLNSAGAEVFTVSNNGSVTAASFSGNGSGLTGITASNADTLDLLDSTDFARVNTNSFFSAFQTFNNGASITGPFGGTALAVDVSGDFSTGLQASTDGNNGLGIYSFTTNDDSTAILGETFGTSGFQFGVFGRASNSTGGIGVVGSATAGSGTTYGVYGTVNSADGFGLGTDSNARVEGLLRSGSESGTSETPSIASGGPYRGLIMRLVNSTSTSTGSVIARTNNLAIERDGTTGGLRATSSSLPSSLRVGCTGMASFGGHHGRSVTLSSFDTQTLVFDGDNAVSLECTLGDPDNQGHFTKVTLHRTSTSDSRWIGVVISTFNQ